MAVLDEGPRDAQVVLLLHGEPTWSYLYRKLVPVLLDAGLRVVAPDLIGFGRSDKPAQVEDYTYARHVEWVRSVLFDELDLRDVVLLCQDWGGLIGLRLLAEHPDRFTRVVAANTGLPDGTRRLPDAWWMFHDFVQKTPDLPIGFLVRSGSAEGLTDDVAAAYDAPFPDASYKAGTRAFPSLIPQTLDDPATPDNQRAWEVLRGLETAVPHGLQRLGPHHRRRRALPAGRHPGAKGQPHPRSRAAGTSCRRTGASSSPAVVVDWLGASRPARDRGSRRWVGRACGQVGSGSLADCSRIRHPRAAADVAGRRPSRP
jgi:haloalkane dehalogenase